MIVTIALGIVLGAFFILILPAVIYGAIYLLRIVAAASVCMLVIIAIVEFPTEFGILLAAACSYGVIHLIVNYACGTYKQHKAYKSDFERIDPTIDKDK